MRRAIVETEFYLTGVPKRTDSVNIALAHGYTNTPKILTGEFMRIGRKIFAVAFIDSLSSEPSNVFFIAGERVIRLDDQFECSLEHGTLFSRFHFKHAHTITTVRYFSFFRHLLADPADPFRSDIFEWVSALKHKKQI